MNLECYESRTSWIRTICVVALAWFAVIAVNADEDPPNTGVADPVALVTAFDRFAAGDDEGKLLAISLSSLRGVTSESLKRIRETSVIFSSSPG
jgi:hypothetical protein